MSFAPVTLAAALATAASFSCVNPSHHDGDNMRCTNVPGSMRLQGIDAPEMPGACRPGRICVQGDPFAARDYLRSLTQGRDVQCVQEDTDFYGRRIVNCTADGKNISCAMIAGGMAVPRYAPLDCGAEAAAASPAPAADVAAPAPTPVPEPERVIVPTDTPIIATPNSAGATGSFRIALLVLAALLVVNAITWTLVALDKRRAQAGRSRQRIAESTLLGWAAVGGSPAAWLAISRLRHKSTRDSFKLRLLLISGLQAGGLIGGLCWWLTA